MKKGDYVKLQKVSDNMFNGAHPNFINKGHTVYGKVIEDLGVGLSFKLIDVKGDSDGWFHTSPVLEIIDENTFVTLNSTYKVTLFDASINHEDMIEFQRVLNDN